MLMSVAGFYLVLAMFRDIKTKNRVRLVRVRTQGFGGKFPGSNFPKYSATPRT